MTQARDRFFRGVKDPQSGQIAAKSRGPIIAFVSASTSNAAAGTAAGRGDGASRGGGQRRGPDLGAAAERVHENRERVEADKGGIIVSSFVEDVIIAPGATHEWLIRVHNRGEAFRALRRASLLRGTSSFALPRLEFPLELDPDSSVTLRLVCAPRQPGVVRDVLSLEFGQFSIGRFLEARCGDAAVLESLRPSAPLVRRKRTTPAEPATEVMPAPPLEVKAPDLQGPSLGFYDMPPNWKQQLRGGEAETELENCKASFESKEAARALRGLPDAL